MAEPRVVERFRKRTIWFHWIHTAAFLVLLVTGAILFLPGLGAPAAGGITRSLHRIAAVVFIAAPVLYTIINPKMSWRFVKETFTWGKDDIKWLQAAPDYYFGGGESRMIPQGHVNTGQKMWEFITLFTGILFVVTGLLMWFLKDTLSPGVFQWMVIVHDFAFILAFLMLLVHIYTGSLHPRMKESLRSMWDGKVSRGYARSHYSKWYDEISKGSG
ncbi:MAG TPA: hypothetical protein G4O16_02150 [Dehalococcoidia bacterium]|nr:hypothetical protein [Dehalococcoidia bacterium]